MKQQPNFPPIEEWQLKKNWTEGTHLIIQPVIEMTDKQDEIIHYFIFASVLAGRKRHIAQVKTQRGKPKSFVSFRRALQWCQSLDRDKIMIEADFDALPLWDEMDFI